MRDLFYLGLSNALVVAFLAVPAYCISRWGKRPALAHVIWLLILIKLVTPPLWQVPVSMQSFAPRIASTTNDNLPSFKELAADKESMAATRALPEAVFDNVPPIRILPNTETDNATSIPVTLAAETPPAPVAKMQSSTDFPWQEALGICWLAGSFVVFTLTIWRTAAFARCLHRIQPARPAVQALAKDLSQRLGLRCTPHLGIAPIRMAPLVWGLGMKPRMVIPAELWETLDAEQRAMLLAHELAHLRRGDHWVRFLEIVVRGVYWWHPVVWLAAREMREAEEQCCDAWAVWARPHAANAYARAIVDTVDFLSQRSMPLPVGASGIGQVQDLRRRLIMIMRGTTPRKLSATALAGLAVLGGALILMGPSFGMQRSTAESIAADDPLGIILPRSADLPSEDDQNNDAEIARLRQQQAALRQAMDAVARSLEQTNSQLKQMQGGLPTNPAPLGLRPSIKTPPALSADRPTGAQPPQPRPRANRPTRAPGDYHPGRNNQEQPVEERLGRLEEQLSQIADDLRALHQQLHLNLPLQPRMPRSARPSVTPPAPLAPEPQILPRGEARPFPVPPEVPEPPPARVENPADLSMPSSDAAPATRALAPAVPRRPGSLARPSADTLAVPPAPAVPTISPQAPPAPPKPASGGNDGQIEDPVRGPRP